jgi:hypothetical protein
MGRRLTDAVILALGLVVLGASITVFAAPQVTRIQQNVNCSLPANTYCLSNFFSSVIALDPSLSSTSPSGQTICVGYVDSNLKGQCTEITGSGLGSTAGAGSWYCFYANSLQSYNVGISGVCTGYYD